MGRRTPRRATMVAGTLIGVLGLVGALGLSAGVAGASSGSGTVQVTVEDNTGNPLPGACLFAGAKKSNFTSAASDASGSITETSVPDGKYQGYLFNCGEPNGESFGGVTVSFKVKNGVTTNLGTIELEPTGAAFGSVDDSNTGVGAPFVSVTAWSLSSEVQVAPPACTGPDGSYTIFNLPTAGVKLEFAAGGQGCGNDPSYDAAWSGGSSYATAATIPVQAQCCGTDVPTLTLTAKQTSANGKVTITSVAITGEPSSPEITVMGSGFGKKAPTGTTPGCSEPPSGVGENYGTDLYFNDYSSSQWEMGTGGDCIGIVVTSYTNTEIVLSPGGWYGWSSGGAAEGIALNPGDPFTMTVKGANFTGIT